MSSYVVLARKYRPRNFAEMVGQSHVVQALSNALTSQRLHHAYLFTGTRGVGKTTVSRILAKSLNCLGADGQGGITAEPCGVCQSCTDIDAGRFVDYTELDAASNRSVGEMQTLLEQSVYKPVQGRFKVFMIDEVHMLTGHAFNAMLKTLEEPPEYLKFVLATTDPQKVPVTVLSRCLQFNLRPMAPQTVQEHLQHVLQAEGVSAEPNALRLIARAARGSMRDALSLTDQALSFGAGELPEAVVRQMLGAVDRTHVFQLIDALGQGDGATVVNTIDGLRVNGLNAASTLEEMTTVLQRMAVVQAVPDHANVASALDDPDAVEIERLAHSMPADETQLLYSLCLHGRAELGLAPDEYAALTMVLLRLLAFKPAGASVEKKTLKSAPEARPESKSQGTPDGPEALGRPDSPPQVAPLKAAPAAARPVLTAVPVHATRSTTPPGPAAMPIAAPLAGSGQTAQPASAFNAEDEGGAESEDDAPPWESLSTERPEPAVVARSMRSIPVREAGVSTRLDQRREPEEKASARELQSTPEGDFWMGLVQALIQAEAVTALVRELALQSQLVARDGERWLLRVERESLSQSNAPDRLASALATLEHRAQVVVEIGTVNDSPALRLAALAAQKQREAEAIIMGDAFVQSVVRDFGGKIVPGTLKATG
ncbi:DNA polymerase III subunit gamma/tau [Hydrogenophaga crassostreae]|uniref:DNA polymerase III subunit gamma/tau n=1 Tax=Hydrogenophaga crassostreae TaxID=1763535 RepID=A0A167IHA3_9BURK|nr:DNA polymerase III subunit gamma/tau [Hydrogenophaga crassostreae]AOW13106.1 DNA polymerase III, subunit gamma and tau [Hydrogenophaga crassostreae]OAD42748.1 DNA polymerase III subunit gamma/tau [Hydrogenophaga crassostreae]